MCIRDSTDTTRGVNFLERYKDGYLHGNLYPGADNTYDLGSSNYAWKNAYFESNIILNGTGRIQGVDTVSANTDAANKLYVDQQLAGSGLLLFQGGYNASTNTPDLDSSPSSSIKKGWSYVVTADGSFFTEQVRTPTSAGAPCLGNF